VQTFISEWLFRNSFRNLFSFIFSLTPFDKYIIWIGVFEFISFFIIGRTQSSSPAEEYKKNMALDEDNYDDLKFIFL